MNKQKQIEAMARLDGWAFKEETKWLHPHWARGNETRMRCPDYFTDNEIDRMVRGLDEKELIAYHVALHNIVGKRIGREAWQRDLHQATEEQKVEAYLKAKGAWEDEVN